MNEHTTLHRDDGLQIDVAYDVLKRTRLALRHFDAAWQTVAPQHLHPKQRLRITVDLTHVVGHTPVVKAPLVTPTETASFARRFNAPAIRPSRVVHMQGDMPTTTHVTIIGEWHSEGLWKVRTAYPGQFVYPQAWDFSAILREGVTLKPVLDYWCRTAFLYRSGSFETRSHDDTWAGLIDTAAAFFDPQVVKAVGYDEVSQQWMT